MNETVPLVLEGELPLVAMLTMPGTGSVRSRGLVICGPLGHENICSYRPLRTLAEHLASHGWPVLRFDWPGCGDSPDLPADQSDLTVWIESVRRAIDALRRHAGVDRVALVGLRVGGTLGMLAAVDTPTVDELVLLAPFPTGRSYLRQLRAFEAMVPQPPLDVARTWQAPEGIATGGFVFSPDQVAALEAADLTTVDEARLAIQRALVIVAQPERGVTSLVQRLEQMVPDLVHEADPSLASAWDDTTSSAFPVSSANLVSEWLMRSGDPVTRTGTFTRPREAVLVTDGVREETIVLDGPRSKLVAVTCEPVAPSMNSDAVLFLSAGGVRRSGPNRLWTTLARSWAKSGLRSLRLDVSGVGDSGGPPEAGMPDVSRFYTTDVRGDALCALDWLESRGAARVTAVGLCSGAYWSFQTALSGATLSTICMVNPAVFFWDEHDKSLHAISHAWTILKSPRSWPRIFGKGARSHKADVLRGVRRKLGGHVDAAGTRDAILRSFEQLRDSGIAAHAIYSQGDFSQMHVERHLGPQYVALLEAAGASVDVIEGSDHTFRPLWSHELLRDSLEGHLRRTGMLAATAPATRLAATSTTVE